MFTEEVGHTCETRVHKNGIMWGGFLEDSGGNNCIELHIDHR
jgi:hypothetical protein